MSPISGEQLPANVCFGATGAALVGAAGLVVYFLRARVKRPAVVEEPDADLQPLHSTDDPQHHARVLAKTRQAAHISNAVAYTKGRGRHGIGLADHAWQEGALCVAFVVLSRFSPRSWC